jgi:NAD(P)-dependent dehydrogenase (short-subunit alcohol dehydrogenase family)
MSHPATVDDTASVEAFDKQMAVNARSVMLCYKHAAKQMIAQGRGGRIIGTYTHETYYARA